MKECPEMRDLAHFVETGEGAPEMIRHLERCDACQEARENFEDEAMSLQISISELWFREQISCPDPGVLQRLQAGTLPAEERAYVDFHLETLACKTCQGRFEEAELSRSVQARGRASRSKKKVADATIKLLGDLRGGKTPR
jgi:hypothetical protein